MSSNGTRKETRGWAINGAPGQLINIETDDVPIEEVVADSVPTVVSRDAARMAENEQRRGRRSTLETFNDELSLLDRPLANDVEYFDEAPPRSRFKGVAVFAGIVLGMGMAGGLVLSRRHAVAQPSAQDSQQVASQKETALAVAPVAAAEPVLAAQVAAAPAPEATVPRTGPAPAVDDDDSATDDDPVPAPTRGAWDKVKARAGHAKQSRSASAKSAHHRGSSKRTVSAKHSSSRRN